MKKVLVTVLVTVLLVVALFAVVTWGVAMSGAIDVAATHPHVPGVRWLLETTRERSIATRVEKALASGDMRVPDLEDPRRLEAGVVHYHDTCVTCHGAPGVEPSAIGQGLNPEAPDLSHEDDEPAEVFWILDNGIRMTAMPAFGETHSDDELWDVVAFVAKLQGMTPDEYAGRVEAAGLELRPRGHEHGGDGHGGHEGSGDQGRPTSAGEEAEGSSTGGDGHADHDHDH